MNCFNCGHYIKPNSEICPACGTEVSIMRMSRKDSPNIQSFRPHETILPRYAESPRAVWVCEECGELYLDEGGDVRPACKECGEPLSALQVFHSAVRGVGTRADLDLGLALLLEAQS